MKNRLQKEKQDYEGNDLSAWNSRESTRRKSLLATLEDAQKEQNYLT